MNQEEMAIHAEGFFGSIRNTALGLAERRDLGPLFRVMVDSVTNHHASSRAHVATLARQAWRMWVRIRRTDETAEAGHAAEESLLRQLRQALHAEYAEGASAFGNFDSLARLLPIPREEVLIVYLAKHVDGVISWQAGHKSPREPVTWRLTDVLVYCALLDAMLALLDARSFGPPKPYVTGVVLLGWDQRVVERKIPLIKLIREFTGLSLVQAKNAADRMPVLIGRPPTELFCSVDRFVVELGHLGVNYELCYD